MTFDLPRNNQQEDFVRYRRHFPELPEAFACAWITTKDFEEATIWSYALDNLPDAYALHLINRAEISVTIMRTNLTYSLQRELPKDKKVRKTLGFLIL